MAKALVMPIFTDALIADTTHLSTEQFGAYVLLLMALWRNDGKALIDDNKQMANLCRVSTNRWHTKLRPILAEFFAISEGCWRLAEAQQGRIFTRNDNGRLGWTLWADLRQEIFIRDGRQCVYCGSKDGSFECDHIIPLSRGGTNHRSNLATACEQCNREKRARTPEEWGIQPTFAQG